MEKKHNGAHNELVATVWLLKGGYEVFRNVSSHGGVDIIAMKNGVLTLFDVKKASLRTNGEPLELKLKREQIARGVKLLCVYGDDRCRIIDNPLAVHSKKGRCLECAAEFTLIKPRQTFCSSTCRVRVKNRKRYFKKDESADGFAMEGRPA